jgi:hypothetical protein
MLEMASLDSTFAEAGTFRDLGSRPIVVLTAMAPMDSASPATLGMTRAQRAAFKAEWKRPTVEAEEERDRCRADVDGRRLSQA